MDDNKILELIKTKELEIKKLQLEVVELKKQLNQQTTNEKENTSEET